MAQYEILDSEERLDQLLAANDSRKVVIFKHSLTCPISTAAFRQYERLLADREADDDELFTLIEIQRQRGLSNKVAGSTGVRHESPQALVLEGGRVTWHASHSAITVASLAAALG